MSMNAVGIGSDKGDIHFADLCDFPSTERSQILDPSSGDNNLIEKQMDLLTFLVNYTVMLYLFSPVWGKTYSWEVRKLNWVEE